MNLMPTEADLQGIFNTLDLIEKLDTSGIELALNNLMPALLFEEDEEIYESLQRLREEKEKEIKEKIEERIRNLNRIRRKTRKQIAELRRARRALDKFNQYLQEKRVESVRTKKATLQMKVYEEDQIRRNRKDLSSLIGMSMQAIGLILQIIDLFVKDKKKSLTQRNMFGFFYILE